MSNSKVGVNELIVDDYFRKWVNDPDDKQCASFWEEWLKNNPDKAAEVEEARQLVLTLRFKEFKIGENDLEQLWRKIKEGENSVPSKKKKRK